MNLPRLWYMNADFEVELASTTPVYKRHPWLAAMNQQLAPKLIWLMSPGDALLLEQPWSESLIQEAQKQHIELIAPDTKTKYPHYLFTPWGWTASTVALGQKLGAIVENVPLAIVQKVNSKLFSYQLEQELGVALPGSIATNSWAELGDAVASLAPDNETKWVIKSPLGFAARERVLGRGQVITEEATKWCQRRLATGEMLILQPWLTVVREYGVNIEITKDGQSQVLGISDLQANGAGTGVGYLLGRPPSPERLAQLTEMAQIVGRRLHQAGYHGPAGLDALEHTDGLHPLLEINARYTMGFVAVAVEQKLKVKEPTIWSVK